MNKLLQKTDHRPWTIPQTKWTFYQEWNNAVFLHWKVNKEELTPFLPPELELDVFDGTAWVSLVAFTMEKSRIRYLPSCSLVSNFHQINIRTYVKHRSKPGVFFLSIEAGKKISSKIAAFISELPYTYSKIKRTTESTCSKNINAQNCCDITYHIGSLIKQKEALDIWLTERYALFQNTNTALNKYEIHHIEWPLYSLKIHDIDIGYERFKFINNSPEWVGYSTGVQVIAWRKERFTLAYPNDY